MSPGSRPRTRLRSAGSLRHFFGQVMGDTESHLKASSSSENLPRADSKLYNSVETYGTNSYYYAHARSKEFVVPENAKVVEGPGIITGGAPVRISVGEPIQPSIVMRKIEKYSWCDDGKSVRIYVDDPSILSHLNLSTISITFDDQALSLEVMQSGSVKHVLAFEKLEEEIDRQASTFVLKEGKRVTITLAKKDADKKWYSLYKKK
jgi:hypothetical protein